MNPTRRFVLHRLAPAFLAAQLFAGGHGAGAAPARPAWAEESPVARLEARLRLLRARLAPAIEAFRHGRRHGVRAWLGSAQRPSERTFAALLLARLGERAAKAQFVRHFPDRDRGELAALMEIGQVTCPGDACLSGQPELACAAVQDWPGARVKLLRVRAITSGALEAEHDCALTLLAVRAPDEVLALARRMKMEQALVQALSTRLSARDAGRMREHLQDRRYPDSKTEALRTSLLPLLAIQATRSDAPEAERCSPMRCEQAGRLR